MKKKEGECVTEKKGEIVQVSEHHWTALILAVVGGFLDAYSYICRDQVFANAETGNIVLMGVALAQKNFAGADHYFLPIGAFAVGVYICEMIRHRYGEERMVHWRQRIVVLEILGVGAVAFMPLASGWNHMANITISFVCALQVEAFRKVRGVNFASTMCTGNLRSATERLFKYRKTGNKQLIRESNRYYLIIGAFVVGAAIGGALTMALGGKAVLISLIGLVAVLLMMNKEFARL